MHKSSQITAVLLLFITAVFIFTGCATLSETEDHKEISVKSTEVEYDIQPGLYDGGPRGIIEIEKDGPSFLGTYGPEGHSTIVLWKEGNSWKGMWEEPGSGKAGLLYDISITRAGTVLAGMFSTSKTGETNTFTDTSFRWERIE